MKIRLFYFLIIAYLQSYSQNQIINCESIKSAGDCFSAIEVKPINKIIFNCSPKGYGKQLEIKNHSFRSQYFFENEHHTVWIKFSCPYNALLTFDIIPDDYTDDLDFLLFKIDSTNQCEKISSGDKTPVRTNISRNNKSKQSVTGIKIGADRKFNPSGINPIYSKEIKVNKQDQFFLVIDNVYGGENGFSIVFNYFKNKKINGVILDKKTSKPIYSNIRIENEKKSEIIAFTKSDSNSGHFSLNFNEEINEKYFLITESENYFFTEKSIPKSNIHDSDSTELKITVPRLEKNEKLQLHHLNFYGNSDEYLPSALGSLKRLLSLLIKNPSLKIQIEGHTNGCSDGVAFSQMLSENRAKTIKKFMIDKGIDEKRLTAKGFNCSKMLYPYMKNTWEQMMNRRVEILVLEF